jgi:transcriptional regulator with XRE-family HTH domain
VLSTRSDSFKLRLDTEEVLQALTRYTKETNDSERQTATKLGVNCMTLSTWLHGKEPPQKCTLARLAGFLRRLKAGLVRANGQR